MDYSFEERSNGTYILTNEKHDNKDIVIKMDSIIKEEVLTECVERSTYNVTWKLDKNDDGLCLIAKINNQTYTKNLDSMTIISELISMVKENKTLEYCKNLLNEINNLFNDIFSTSLKDRGLILTSNNIVKGIVTVYHNGKILGYATRFLLDASDRLYICEYIGKPIHSDMELSLSVRVGNQMINLGFISYIDNEDTIYSPSISLFGYFGINIRIRGVNVTTEDEIIYPQINVPNIYSTSIEMNEYCKRNNQEREIQEYKIALKPKVQLLNINSFMLREFTI